MFNSKTIRLALALIIAGFVIFPAGTSLAAHPYKTEAFKLNAESIEPKRVTLGSGVSCANDFAVTNSSKNPIEIRIVLGGMPFARDLIPANGMKMYNLRKNLSIAKLNGKTVGMDDWAFIINGIKGNNSIMVYCSH